MKVLIAGMDGYLGWPLTLYLASRGHVVAGVDACLRRSWVSEVGSKSAIPVAPMAERLKAFYAKFGTNAEFKMGNLCEYGVVQDLLRSFRPDAIVHLAEMPSAPYSMIDVNHCVFTQHNNIVGTLNLLYAMRDECPDAHLVKLGTMGEYGTPNLDIPEGFFDIEYRGRKDRLPFPRQAGSWYHQTKVHDTHNIMMACKIWELRSTDIMQGVVYGTRIDQMGDSEALRTRFDFDQCFGTAINRFCAQAVVGHPLTVLGTGGQQRGFLPLRDSMQCLTLALETPPERGEYRVFNQFEDVYSVKELAERVRKVAISHGIQGSIECIENRRVELERHYYNPDHKKLFDLGYKPSRDMDSEILQILRDLQPFRDRILDHKNVLVPDIWWRGNRKHGPRERPA